MKKNWTTGSSLIEIVIATAVVGVVLTGIMMSLTFSVKTTAEAKYRALASKKAQEAIEVMRREKDLLGWDAFYSATSKVTGYCFNTLPSPNTLASEPKSDCNNAYGLVVPGVGVSFMRVVQVQSSTDTVAVEVTVYWPDSKGGADHEVTLDTVINRW